MLGLILSGLLGAHSQLDMAKLDTITATYIASIQYQIPPSYLIRLVEKESRFDKDAISKNKNGTFDVGLLQHNSKYYDDFKWRYNKGKDYDPYDIRDNLKIGCKHLLTLYKHTGSWRATVIAWNCGLTRYRSGDYPVTSIRLANAVVGLI